MFNFSSTTGVPRALVAAGLVILQSGCMLGPDYQKKAPAVPQDWVSETNPPVASEENTVQQDWWQNFHDPVLNRLIEKASRGNLDIELAKLRIAEARAAKSAASFALFPSGDVMASANRQANQIAFPRGGPTDFSSLLKTPFSIFKTGFDASWELDLFGGRRRELESAKAELEASAVSKQDVLISTLAEVARTYLDIRMQQSRLNNARDIAEADRKTVAISSERFQSGETPGSDMTLVQARFERDQGQIAHFSNQLAQAEFSMDVLLGEKPGAAREIIGAYAPVPFSDKKLILDAPAAVIANRPDIRQAERKLAAATAQQGVALAKFFPDISLAGFLGLFNTNAGNLFNVGSKSWSMGASVFWPILGYGALSANLDVADAKQREAMANYQRSVLAALSDVERSFTAYTEQEKLLRFMENAVTADQHSFEIANERYREGVTSFLEVLDSQRGFYASRDQLAVAQAQTSQNLVAVYKSLGGGWKPLAVESGADQQGDAR